MASDHDRSVFVEPLPAKPNLEMQQKRAKDLLRAAWDADPDAWQRIRALHPKPPAADALRLADAQLVIARGYGFESWAAMKGKIDSLTRTPLEQFKAALRGRDVDRVRTLLETHAEVRAAINTPLGDFGGRPLHMAGDNLALIDLLLSFGADINLKSDWKPGPFSLIEGAKPALAAALIARGATVDVVAAASLGMIDRVRELVEQDPSLVHARGGDGKTPLHYAKSVELARYLLEHGADIDARDVDHFSTAAQYLAREAPDVVRLLVERGAWFDIFIAVAIRDAARVERCLRDDPEALDHQIGQRKYTLGRDDNGVVTPEQQADLRGDTYRWVFGPHLFALDVAAMLGFDDMVTLLLRHATPAQSLLAACSRADRAAALAIVAAHPGLVATLRPDQRRVIADKASDNNTAAVQIMLEVGFDPRVTGWDRTDAYHWAAFHGNVAMIRAMLPHNPPVGVKDPQYQGTPLGWCVYGSLHGWHNKTGDHATSARLLIEAGEYVDPTWLPTGRDDVDVVMREFLAKRG